MRNIYSANYTKELMKLNKTITILLLLACVFSVQAQRRPFYDRLMDESQDTVFSKWEPHLAVGTGFMATTRGDNRIFTSVAPSLTYHANDRLSFYGAFSVISDLGLNPNYNVGRSYAPRRNNGGTGLVSVEAGGEYRLNENIWLAASVWHVGGQYAPLFGPLNGSTMDVSATAISAAAAFRFKNDNYLHLSFTFVRDHAGTLPWMYHDAYMHSGWGWGGYMGSPSTAYGCPMGFGGWCY